MSRPIHFGTPPSRCGRATATSAWTPDEAAADCQWCMDTWVPPGPSSRTAPADEEARVLQAWRLGAGLTQAEAAGIIGVARTTYLSWEKRGAKIGLRAVCRLLGVAPSALFGVDPPGPQK